MEKNKYPGKFIVFEGLDGSGKSTQANMLVDFIQQTLGQKAHYTSEPTPNIIGGLIRSQLAGDWKTSNECLQLLFSADRLYHLEKEIRPMLEQGISVVCDRYFFSTIAYGANSSEDAQWLLTLNEKVLLPDSVFLLRISPQGGVARIHGNRHGIRLFEKEEILKRVAGNYDTVIQQFPDITHVVNGEQSKEQVANEIQERIRQIYE